MLFIPVTLVRVHGVNDISHRYTLSQFSEALGLAGNSWEAIKVLIDCQA